MATASADPIGITALGMITAVGDAPTACAAARAGLMRVRELKVLNFAGDQIWGGEPVVGHAAPLPAEGFKGVPKALILGRHALADVLARARLGPQELARTGIHITLADQFLPDAYAIAGDEGMLEPPPEEADEAVGEPEELEEIDPDEPREPDEPEEAPKTPPLPSVVWREQCKGFVPTLLKRCGIDALAPRGRLLFGNHTGAISALEEATEQIRRGEVDRCLIGGIDCCLEPMFLVAAVMKGLLKTPLNPCGFLPGEAAAFVLVEKVSAARARGMEVMAAVGPVAVGQEDSDRFSDKPPLGVSLAQTIRKVVSQDTSKSRKIGLVIGDLNGDAPRAMDWGNALVRLQGELRLGEFPTWLPAQAFGETGAATGALAICLGARALQRKYAPPGAVLIWLSSDNGARAAACLEAVSG
jgi:hypothetical protein